MKQSAKVIEVNNEVAIVEVSRTTICEGCHKHEGGSACSACLTFGDRKASAKALNKIGASVGDRVVVEASSGRIIIYSAIIFFLPILLALGVYLLTATNEFSILYTIVTFAASFLLGCVILEKYAKKKPDLTVVGYDTKVNIEE
jgi:positive regulator of sigma E activity